MEEPQFEFEPFVSIFLKRRDEILRLVGIASYALRSMEGMGRLTEVLRKSPEEIGRAKEMETRALAEAAADLPHLHSAATVLIWGSLEAAFRDFLVRWLTSRPSARTVPDLSNVRVRVAEYEAFSGEERMRYLVGVLEKEFAAALKPGVGRFECLLKPFGLRPRVNDQLRKDLSELAAVRNVIVHRAGVADARFVALCPWLGLKIGDAVAVSSDSFYRYVNAASSYAAAIVECAQDGVAPEGNESAAAQQCAAGDVRNARA